MPSLVEIGPVILEKKMKMWKVYNDDDDNDADNGQIVFRKAYLSLWLRWANKTIDRYTWAMKTQQRCSDIPQVPERSLLLTSTLDNPLCLSSDIYVIHLGVMHHSNWAWGPTNERNYRSVYHQWPFIQFYYQQLYMYPSTCISGHIITCKSLS